MSPFDYVKNLTFEKKYLINSKEEEINYRESAFVVNMAFSFGKSTIMFANEMNKRFFVLFDNAKIQYDFYFFGLPKQKVFNKWVKDSDVDKIKIIQEYYCINYKRAKEYLSILSKDQFDVIQKSINSKK